MVMEWYQHLPLCQVLYMWCVQGPSNLSSLSKRRTSLETWDQLDMCIPVWTAEALWLMYMTNKGHIGIYRNSWRMLDPFQLAQGLETWGVRVTSLIILKLTSCRSALQLLLHHSHRNLRAREANARYLSHDTCTHRCRLVLGIQLFNTTKHIHLENNYLWKPSTMRQNVTWFTP